MESKLIKNLIAKLIMSNFLTLFKFDSRLVS